MAGAAERGSAAVAVRTCPADLLARGRAGRHLPAGLSPAIVGQELRGRNGFTGVTITDALEAGALNRFGGTGQRAVTADAGMDLILCSARDPTQSQTAAAALASALTSGQLDPAAFNAAFSRVTALRAGLF